MDRSIRSHDKGVGGEAQGLPQQKRLYGHKEFLSSAV
jgi:hypothetical protein